MHPERCLSSHLIPIPPNPQGCRWVMLLGGEGAICAGCSPSRLKRVVGMSWPCGMSALLQASPSPSPHPSSRLRIARLTTLVPCRRFSVVWTEPVCPSIRANPTMLGGTSGEYGKSVAGKLGGHHADPPGIHKLKLAGYRRTGRPEAIWCSRHSAPPPALHDIVLCRYCAAGRGPTRNKSLASTL